MERPAHIGSYYAASAHAAPPRSALEGSVECDVCVVGGGIAGCSSALHLAQSGLRVVLLEQHRVSWGASGRSGGQALFGIATGQGKLERLIGAADARAVWEVSVEALVLMRDLIRRYSIDCDWSPGYLYAAVKERHVRELHEELAELRERLNYPSVRYVPREELREPECVVERMEVGAVAVEERSQVAIGSEQLAQLRARHVTHAAVAEPGAELGEL